MSGFVFANAQVHVGPAQTASSLRVRRGRVTGLDKRAGGDDFVIDCASCFVLPGLINAHDHLGLNHYPATRYQPRYAHAVDWFVDMEANRQSDPHLVQAGRANLDDRLWFGGLKNLLGGATTVAHHNPLWRPLRGRFWHPLWPGRERAFPVHVLQQYGFAHSLFRGEDAAASYRNTTTNQPWIIHLAEGTDERAAAELGQLDKMGALGANTVLVHGVGLTEDQRALLVARGGGLVWCPSANEFLLGETARVAELASAGRLALGTDARLTGSRDLLAEIKVAARTGQLTPAQLLAAVTVDAAALLRLRGHGSLSLGGPADLIMLPPIAADAATALLAADRADLRLVMRAGRPMWADPDLAPLFNAAGVGSEKVTLDGRPKIMAGWLARRLRRLRLKEPGLAL